MPGAPTSKGQVCLICHRTDHIFLGDRVHLELMAEDGTKIRMDAHPTAVPDADQFAVHFDPQNTVVIANTNNIRTGEL